MGENQVQQNKQDIAILKNVVDDLKDFDQLIYKKIDKIEGRIWAVLVAVVIQLIGAAFYAITLIK